jgi:hypothetical protein
MRKMAEGITCAMSGMNGKPCTHIRQMIALPLPSKREVIHSDNVNLLLF